MNIVRWAVFSLLFAVGAMAAAPAKARVIFDPPVPRVLNLARGDSAVISFSLLNTGLIPVEESLVVSLQPFELSNSTYRIEAASDCLASSPRPGLIQFQVVLQPDERRDCAYRITRTQEAVSDLMVAMRLGRDGGGYPIDPLREGWIAVGDLVEIRTSLVRLGAPRAEQGVWRQSAEWRVTNLGPSPLSSVRYGTCDPFLPARVDSTGPECQSTSGNALCLGPGGAGLTFGPLAVGETRTCRVELRAFSTSIEYRLGFQGAGKPGGGFAGLSDDSATRLTLVGTPPRPVPMPAAGVLAQTFLVALILFGFGWRMRSR